MYENLPDDDMRAEAARYLYMHHYGGTLTLQQDGRSLLYMQCRQPLSIHS